MLFRSVEIAGNSNWIETALWYGAAVFLFIATVRLIRRTQAFVTWLIGFLLYGGRWALTLQDQGGVMPAVQALTVDSFRPENITTTSTPGQLALLAALLVVGIVIFIVDHTDRKHWAAQAA